MHEYAIALITLIVQDWGGPIGLSYAMDHPGIIKRIVIMNTWMWPVNTDWYYGAFSKFTGGAIGRFLIQRYNFFNLAGLPYNGIYDNFLIIVSFVFNGLTIWYAWRWVI